MILITMIFGAAYVLTPLRITYAVESSGVHCIPGSEATCNIRQLPCFAKGGCLPASVQPREVALLCLRMVPSRLHLLAISMDLLHSINRNKCSLRNVYSCMMPRRRAL